MSWISKTLFFYFSFYFSGNWIKHIVTTMEEITLKEMLGGKEGIVKINYSKIKDAIKKCQVDKTNQVCKEHLKSIGVEWIE